MTRPFFARERISDYETFHHYTDQTLSLLSDITQTGPRDGAVDVQDLYARFTLDAASEFLFGECLNTLKLPYPVAGHAKLGPKGSLPDTGDAFTGFARAFEQAQLVISLRVRLSKFWPLRELFTDETEASMQVIRAFLSPIVEKSVEEVHLKRQRGEKVAAEDTTANSFR